MTPSPLLARIEVETASEPRAAVIWLHGLGADGNDFAPVARQLDLSDCPPIRFVFPHAPAMPVTLNGGHPMPAWYDLYGRAFTTREDDAGIRASEAAVNALIAHEVGRGIAAERIVLGGFSQGCAMALHTALRHPARLAGVMALSGYLPLAALLAAERQGANAATPIFMAHGSDDPVVPLDYAEASRDALMALAHPVEWHTYPMPHSVHPQELADIAGFLRRVLGANARA